MLTISTQLFDYANRGFTAEASDLGWDKTPREFFMRSAVTGALVHFKWVQTEWHEEDILSWIYESEHLPSIGGTLFATVYND